VKGQGQEITKHMSNVKIHTVSAIGAEYLVMDIIVVLTEC